MSPRLLSLLSLVENSLINNGAAIGSAPAQRTVSFHKGVASMTFGNGAGGILLQSYSLADGQSCVRATYSWRGTTAQGSCAIYPKFDFNWAGAAEQIAMGWMDGMPETPAEPESASTGAVEQVQAAG